MFCEHKDEAIKDAMMNSCCSFPVAQAQSTFDFLTAIADGNILTHATETRNWIHQNPLYKNDSILSPELQDELIDWYLVKQRELDPVDAEYVILRTKCTDV
jgi:1,2-phenylacetyl-CoA epoxidase catalytic subunit